MHSSTDFESIAAGLVAIVEDIVDSHADRLIECAGRGERREIENPRHPGSFLSQHDVELNEDYFRRLPAVLASFVYASEESEPRLWPEGSRALPDWLVVVDPLDSTEQAVRGLHAHTHLVLYSLQARRPVVSVVGDFFHAIKCYWAASFGSTSYAVMKTRRGDVVPCRCSTETDLRRALLTNYLMKPLDRFRPLADQHSLLRALAEPDKDGHRRGRIGVDFGAIGLCHVAAGFTDAMLELTPGWQVWDLLPGHHILRASGGSVISLDGSDLSFDLGIDDIGDVEPSLEKRREFVAAGTATLAQNIRRELVDAARQ